MDEHLFTLTNLECNLVNGFKWPNFLTKKCTRTSKSYQIISSSSRFISQRLVLTIQTCFGRNHIDRKVKYITSPKRIITLDLAGRTTKAKSHTWKTKTTWYYKPNQNHKKEEEAEIESTEPYCLLSLHFAYYAKLPMLRCPTSKLLEERKNLLRIQNKTITSHSPNLHIV